MKRPLMISTLFAAFAASGLIAQGGLGPIGNLQGKVDANNALVIAAVAEGSIGATTSPIANLRGKVDANNALVVAMSGAQTLTGPMLLGDGTAAAPSYSFASDTDTGIYRGFANYINFAATGAWVGEMNSEAWMIPSTFYYGWTSSSGGSPDLRLFRDAANTLAQQNGTNAQTQRLYAYTSGARAVYTGLTCTAASVTLSGATTATSAFIPAGSTVEEVATTTTTTITGASGYTVGDGSDADRWGSVTGTAVGTVTGSASYTADPRWWTNGARAITLTALTSNFTGGVVQVMACYRTATGT